MKYITWLFVLIVIISAIIYLQNNESVQNKTPEPSYVILGNHNPNTLVKIDYFWSATCPYCREQNKFWEYMVEKYPKITIYKYSLDKSPENANLLKEKGEQYNVGKSLGAIPATFLKDQYFIGFDGIEGVGAKIEEAIARELTKQNNEKN